MKSRPIHLHGNELSISRQIPATYYLCHQITRGLKVEILTKNKPIDLKKYFEGYGTKITYEEYMDDNNAYILFEE
jgi:hypothetical protein